jgi:hypothetical protein
MKPVISLLLLSALLASCGHQGIKEEAVIRGTLAGGGGERLLLLELDPDGSRPVDSTALSTDGSFSFTFKPQETGFYLLREPGGHQAVVVAGKGDEITVTGGYRTMPRGLRVTGPEDAVLLNNFYEYSSRNQAVADSLQQLLADRRDDPGFAELTLRADSLFRRIWEDQKAYEITFLNEHLSSFSSLLILNFSFGVRPVMSLEEDLPYYMKADSALSLAYPANKQVLINRKRIEEFRMQKALKSKADR